MQFIKFSGLRAQLQNRDWIIAVLSSTLPDALGSEYLTNLN